MILRKLEESDLPFLLEVRNDETTRVNLENDSVFTLEQCIEWFSKTKPIWYIIQINSSSVGYIRTNGDEVGIDIHPNYRRMGYAREAYKLYLKEKNYASLWVFVDNFAKNLYTQLGFVENGNTKTIRNREYIQMVYKKNIKVSVAVAAYFGPRDGAPEVYFTDYLHFVKIHLDSLSKMKSDIHKIYFVCTYNENLLDIDYINQYFYKVLEENENIIILNRPNLGGSYAGWHNVLEFDNNESDYIVFVEDDYALEPGGIHKMLEYYKDSPDLLYLCQLWNKERYTKDGVDILEHAQISNGMINTKLYYKLKQEKGLDFTLYIEPGKVAIYNNQASFLEQYRANGILIKDMKEKYSCVYNNDSNSVINFCNPAGEDIFKPITNWYPEHCPNLRYNW
jgi:hypothetical protein